MTYLLDTNIISEFMRPRPDVNVLNWLHDVAEDEVFVSVVTLAELRRGVDLLETGARKSALNLWLRDDLPRRFEGRIFNVTALVAAAWGELMADARRRGVGLHVMDAFIAATARTHSLVLVTRNTKDFASLPIELKNPWKI